MTNHEYAFNRYKEELKGQLLIITTGVKYLESKIKLKEAEDEENFFQRTFDLLIKDIAYLLRISKSMTAKLKDLDTPVRNSLKLNRNTDIIKDRRSGMTYDALALKYNLSNARCRQIVQRYKNVFPFNQD